MTVTGGSAALTFEVYMARVRKVYLDLALGPPTVNSGAKDAQLSALERSFGQPLPPGLRAAWRFANGAGAEEAPVFFPPGYLTGYELLTTDAAANAHARQTKLATQYAKAKVEERERRDERIATGWFPPTWLPFAEFGGGTLRLFADLASSRPIRQVGSHGWTATRPSPSARARRSSSPSRSVRTRPSALRGKGARYAPALRETSRDRSSKSSSSFAASTSTASSRRAGSVRRGTARCHRARTASTTASSSPCRTSTSSPSSSTCRRSWSSTSTGRSPCSRSFRFSRLSFGRDRAFAFDPEPFAPRADAWDRRSRAVALAELAPSLPENVTLVEIKTDSDAYSYVAVPQAQAKRIPAWRKKAHLPLARLKNA